ncbi:hypothetical protein C6501_13455 [Candidatus Poribacteria bacterium]|nr:MAG: hypothetical protein C6501_13455 [Candidatus Poribacteria bacterium]
MKIYRTLFLIKNSCNLIKRAEAFGGFRNLLLIVIAFLLLVPVTHSQNEVGNIHGKLTDKKLGESIANHPVTLNIHKAEDVTQQETQTDENGNYRFDNLPIDVETHYSVSTTYNGAEHIEKDLVLSTWVPNLTINMEISGVTNDTSQIRIKSYTIVIQVPSAEHATEGALSVIEAIVAENRSISPFQTLHEKQAVGFHHGLPKGHKAFFPHAPATLTRSSASNHVMLTEPLPHGQTDIGYRYIYPANEPKLDLSRQMLFRTDQITFLIQDGLNLAPRSKYFKTSKYEAIGNIVYKVYAAAREGGFAAGKMVDLNLGIPKPKSNIGQMAFIAIAAALAGGFLVAAIFMLRRAKRASAESDDAQPTLTDTGWLRKLSDADLDHARTARLEFITLLDEVNEKQGISERVYNRLRKEQTERLTEILDQRKERGLDT